MKTNVEEAQPQENKNQSGAFFRSSVIVAGFSLLSRSLGYVREILMAKFFGTSATAEAINLGLRIPSFFRRIFAEGAFNVTFLPLFSENKKDMKFAAQILSILFACCLLIFSLFEWKFSWISDLIIGNKDQEKKILFLRYGRVIFPYVFFIIIGAFYGGLLNAFGRFSAGTFSYALGNIVTICFFVISHFIIKYCGLESSFDYGLIFSVGILFSGIMQCVFLIVCAWRKGLFIGPRWPSWTPAIKKFIKKFLPGLLSISIFQVNQLIILGFIKFMSKGSLSCLSYADRLNQLPLNLIGISLSSVLLPLFAQQIQDKDEKGAVRTQNQTIRLALFLSLPTAQVMIVLGSALVYLLYGNTKIDVPHLNLIGKILGLYSTGLPAYILIKILNARFFANGHLKITLMGSIINVGIDVSLASMLIKWFNFGALAIPLAASVSAWINLLFLGIKLRHNYGWKPSGLLWRFARRLSLACVLSGMATWVLQDQTAFLWKQKSFLVCLIITTTMGIISVGFLCLSLMMLKVATRRQRAIFKKSLRATLKRKT